MYPTKFIFKLNNPVFEKKLCEKSWQTNVARRYTKSNKFFNIKKYVGKSMYLTSQTAI